MSLPTPDIEKLRELAMKATPGAHEARYVPGGMPTTCCDFGVISHATGKETARVWLREDVEFYAAANPATILALLDSLPSPVSVPEGDARAERERDAWIETARFHARNEEFYRGIVRQIGEMFGEAARTSDDGSIQQDVLALKVPELVAAALLSAESRGERKMQQRAVQVAADYTLRMEIAAQKPHPFTGRENGIAVCKADAGQSITASIRCLSLSSPEEG